MHTEGGSGGKRGHSGMDHWLFTEEIKDVSRVRRRIDDSTESEDRLAEHLDDATIDPGD